MTIMRAQVEDYKEISVLLEQLGYNDTELFLQDKIRESLVNSTEEILVYKIENKVVALLSINFIPQLALKGCFARISYFVVDEEHRNNGIGTEMEEYCVNLAKLKSCDRIEVHCNSKRIKSHQFYHKLGYIESPKYFIKSLNTNN